LNRISWRANANKESEGDVTTHTIPLSELLGPGGGIASGPIKRVGNHLYFYDEISPVSILELNENLKALEKDSQRIAIEYEMEPPPIHLHISSGGGDVHSGIAGMETILNCKVPVYTYVEGFVASAATFLSMAGKKRFIGANSSILIHQITAGFWGKHEEFKDEMANLDHLMAIVQKFYKAKTKLPEKEMQALLKRDLLLDATKCKRYGMVDVIL
jgi:ATP-dependent Clp protease protease subunit